MSDETLHQNDLDLTRHGHANSRGTATCKKSYEKAATGGEAEEELTSLSGNECNESLIIT
jgi:hypothetical protein